jgi:AraC-like DNA-binding protein
MLYNASNYYAQPVVLMSSDIKKLEMAAEILLTQVNKKITIPQLAQMVCLNRKKLKMGFKQLFEVTVYEFAQKAKISKAAELLLETEMTIEEIALELGYSGASSLSIPFKKYFKTTPDEFRYHKPSGLIKHIQSAKSLKLL